MRALYAGLEFVLPPGVVQGDASIGNVLRDDRGHPVVIDLDGFAVGPNRPVKVAWWLIASRMLTPSSGPRPPAPAEKLDRVILFLVSQSCSSDKAPVPSIRLACGLRAAAQAQVPVGGLVAASRAGLHQGRQRYAELACRFRWVWCPAFAVLDAADPRRVASEQHGHVPQGPAAFEPDSADAPGGRGGFGREQDDGRLGTFDPRAHILHPSVSSKLQASSAYPYSR
jgi:hypothetical protein